MKNLLFILALSLLFSSCNRCNNRGEPDLTKLQVLLLYYDKDSGKPLYKLGEVSEFGKSLDSLKMKNEKGESEIFSYGSGRNSTGFISYEVENDFGENRLGEKGYKSLYLWYNDVATDTISFTYKKIDAKCDYYYNIGNVEVTGDIDSYELINTNEGLYDLKIWK